MKSCAFAIIVSFLLYTSCKQSDSLKNDYSGWKAYAGSKDGIRYSSNDQINIGNVAQLKVAWTFSSQDKDTGNRSQIQCNPIVIDGMLYGTSPRLKLFAVDAATGKQHWIFDPAQDDTAARKDPFAFFKICRGVAYWQDETGNDRRIFYSVGEKTYAINAADGKKISSFGNNGFINLTENLDRDSVGKTYVSGTTPGIVYKDLLIIGARVAESDDAAPGHVRAYDVRTGKRRWIFHTIPHPGEFGYDTWPDKDAWKKLGGANNWAGMSLDEERGIVYVPTGTVSGDFYGGLRKGTNLFGNSLIALDASTGKYLWHFQTIHHDLWDRDLPANPNLITIDHDGKKINAVAQISKHGYVFLFDRTNGKPVFPIEEKPVPTGNALPGEEPWPTQPIPSLPEPFARQQFTINDVTNISLETNKEMVERFKMVKYEEKFAPPSKDGSWIFPGYDGGGEWGGSAADPETGILYVMSSEMPYILTMIDVPKNKGDNKTLKGIGQSVYNKYCLACHGPGLKGNGTTFPSLVNIQKKLNEEQVRTLLENGKNMMPAFKQISTTDKDALLAFLLNLKEKKVTSNVKGPTAKATSGDRVAKKSILDEVPYTMTGYNKFLDRNDYPGITPPWGTLNAVNLNNGKLLWKVPVGEYPELTKKGIPITGTELYGGPLVTKGGLVFIAASKDARIRAFDKKTGKVLWEAQLPVPGYATPATYFVNGKQYVVIACGGGKIGSKSGDEYVAFALPD